MKYSFLERSYYRNLIDGLTIRPLQTAQYILEDNNDFYFSNGKIGGLILDSFIAFWDLAYLPREVAQDFVQKIFDNLDQFGSFNFIILILQALFGSESVQVISRTYGSIGLRIINPDESRYKLYVDESGKYYVNPYNFNYVTLAAGNIDNFAEWVKSFCNNFLCAGTTVTGIEIEVNK